MEEVEILNTKQIHYLLIKEIILFFSRFCTLRETSKVEKPTLRVRTYQQPFFVQVF